jgi:D-alanyl-D-alanine carboxypeptidase
MNRTAWRLGALHSHFVNPNGLPADDHYSTARDLTTIFRHALQLDAFVQVISTRQTTIRPVAGSRRNIALRTHNRLLDDLRTSVIGKTGFTRVAKKCFVGAATQNGRRVLVAVLGSSDLWGDLRRLLDWVYDNPEDPRLERNVPGDDDWREAAAAPLGIPRRHGQPRTARSQGDIGEGKEAKQRYKIQLGSFAARADADRLRSKVAALGYSSVVEPIPARRHKVYRVSVLGFDTRGAAVKVAKTLKRTYRLDTRIVSVDA